MDTLLQILALIAAGGLVWFMYRAIKGQPAVFSRENFNKSFTTMGVLGLILIVFVAFLVMLVRTA